MIFRSSKGTSVAGALAYVEGPGRSEQKDRATLLGGDGFGFDLDDKTVEIAKRLMIQNGRREMQGQKDRYCEKDCLHFSLSWHPDQAPPDKAEKLEESRRFLKALGMPNAMHLIYDHDEKSHAHIHIVASRVNPETGMAYDDYKRNEKGLQAALEKEREDEISGRRPIHENRKASHAQYVEPEADREIRREAIGGLYRAHRRERIVEGIKGTLKFAKDLYKSFKEERQAPKEQTRQHVEPYSEKAYEDMVAFHSGRNTSNTLAHSGRNAIYRNPMAQDNEPKRSIVDRILEKGREPEMYMAAGLIEKSGPSKGKTKEADHELEL